MSTQKVCIKVNNLRKIGYSSLKDWMNDENNVYTGRRGRVWIHTDDDKEIFHFSQSKWYNPYRGNDTISRYLIYILFTLDISEFKELKNKNLGCFCVTDQCHAQVLTDLVLVFVDNLSIDHTKILKNFYFHSLTPVINTPEKSVKYPQGLLLLENVLSSEESDELFNHLDVLPYSNALKREVQHYGYEYDYSIREPFSRVLKKIASPPHFLTLLGNMLYNYEYISERPNQIIVNKYLPGEGIGPHCDHHPIFGSEIATLSLGSDVEMDFDHRTEDKHASILLKKGSVLVFGDEARYDWNHSIARRKFELRDNKKIARKTRISVTFRYVNPKYQ